MEYQNSMAFLYSQFKSSEDEEDNNLMAIWNEKSKIIVIALYHYSAVLKAYYHNTGGMFEQEVDKVYDYFFDQNFPYREPLESKIIEDNRVKASLEKMLNIDYIPPNNTEDVRAHLAALWVFYHLLPALTDKPFPLSIVMGLDLALAKLLIKSYMLIALTTEAGWSRDSDRKRFENIRKQKRKEENRQLILTAYREIDIRNKTKNRVAKEIQGILNTRMQNPPGLNTIKRRLEDEGLKPF